MPYLLLIGAVLSNASAGIVSPAFSRKYENLKNGTGFFNAVYAFSACLAWLILFLIHPSFDWGVVLYALGFGAFYVCGSLGYLQALKTGPIMLTSLFIALSLIAVTVWGFFFWNTEFTWLVAIGLVLVAIAIYLCLNKGGAEDTQEEKHPISLKWLFFVALGFVGNAGCTIVQRNQQIAYGGRHGELLMVIATAFAGCVMLGMYLKGDKSDFQPLLKKTSVYPIASGVFNFGVNLFVILLASTALSPSLIYPVLSVGGLAITTVASIFLFKEKMKWWQWLGVVIGAAAVAILSI
jgi:drug/metabolite transporter (DMT)-like permease